MERSSSSPGKSSNCLICQNSFDNGDKDYLPPNNNEKSEEIISLLMKQQKHTRQELVRDVTAALEIFTKLVDGVSGSDDHLGGGVIKELCSSPSDWSQPCCEVCCGVLVNILRLEESIRQNLVKQFKHVDTLRESLKQSLSETHEVSSSWMEARKRLIECVRGGAADASSGVKRSIVVRKRIILKPVVAKVTSSFKSVNKKQVNKKDGLNGTRRQGNVTSENHSMPTSGNTLNIGIIKPCSVKLERLSKDLQGVKVTGRRQGEVVVLPPATETSTRRRKLKTKGYCCTAKMPRKETTTRRISSGNSGIVIKATVDVPNEISENKTFEDVNDDDDFQPSPEDNLLPLYKLSDGNSKPEGGSHNTKATGTNIRTKKKQRFTAKHLNLFYLISNNFLLYKNTPIQFANQKFTCGDMGCSATVEGTDLESFKKLKAHIEDCHSDGNLKKPGQCPICSATAISTGSEMRSHILNCHEPTHAVCEVCWKPFKKQPGMMTNLRNHKWTHKNLAERVEAIANGEKDPWKRYAEYVKKLNWKYKCKACEMRFRLRTVLVKHEKTHMPTQFREKFHCPHCPQLSFLSKLSLHLHLETIHNEAHKFTTICPICNQRLPHKANLEVHMRSHTGEKPFQCEECGKRFASQGHLKTHGEVHRSYQPYQCEYCAKSYKQKRNLVHHQRHNHKDTYNLHVNPVFKLKSTPAEKRPGFIGPIIAYPCNYCNQIFKLKCRRKQHIDKYHGDRLLTSSPDSSAMA